MKSNFSEGFTPLGSSLQEEVRKFSGKTGTNMGRDKKKMAGRFLNFLAGRRPKTPTHLNENPHSPYASSLDRKVQQELAPHAGELAHIYRKASKGDAGWDAGDRAVQQSAILRRAAAKHGARVLGVTAGSSEGSFKLQLAPLGKKKTAAARFQKFYAEALEKFAADDTGMAGQVRVSAPKPPKATEEKSAKVVAPKVPGIGAPKVPFPTVTGIDKQAEEYPARYDKIQNRALRKSAIDNWGRSQKVDQWQQKNPAEGVYEPAGQPQKVKPTDPTNPMGAPAPYNPSAPSQAARQPAATNPKSLAKKGLDTGVQANAADMFKEMDNMGQTR